MCPDFDNSVGDDSGDSNGKTRNKTCYLLYSNIIINYNFAPFCGNSVESDAGSWVRGPGLVLVSCFSCDDSDSRHLLASPPATKVTAGINKVLLKWIDKNLYFRCFVFRLTHSDKKCRPKIYFAHNVVTEVSFGDKLDADYKS